MASKSKLKTTEDSELEHGGNSSHSPPRVKRTSKPEGKKPNGSLHKEKEKNPTPRGKGKASSSIQPAKQIKQLTINENRNLNVVKKIISSFRKSNDRKELTRNYFLEPDNDDEDVNDTLEELEQLENEEIVEDLEVDEPDPSDDDNIDTENLRVPLRTIAINELLFPKHRGGHKSPKLNREKDLEVHRISSITLSSSKAEDPNIQNPELSDGSYSDWDDGLDTVSVRTEDIFTNDGELAPSFTAAQVNEQNSCCTVNEKILSNASSHISSISTSPKNKVSKDRPSTSSNAPTRVIHSHVITPFRLGKTNWKVAYENLTIRKCVENIQSEKLTLSIPTLTSLKFAQLSSFQVISCCLRSFHNLKRLSFSNVALVQKKVYNENDPKIISLPNVTELEMTQWLSSLTKYEYWLLDVFTRSVNFGRLESFTFRGSDFVVGEKALVKCQKLLENIRDTSVVVRFLVKNRNSLRKLSFGGIGFKMMEHYQAALMEPELAKVNHINDFRINLSTFGIDLLLLNQRHIHNLTFTGYVTDFEEAYANLIRKCIESNRNSLVSLGIFPCIVNDGIRPFYGALTPYLFNCGVFETCQNLKSLFLNITAAQKMFTRRYSCGKVTNLHLLPRNLCTIEIYNHDFESADLEKFGQSLYRFRYLHRLVLSSITTNKYLLKVDWIKHLFLLPHFERVDFFGGKLENARMFRDYITSKPPGFITMIQISDCISFYKPHLFIGGDESDNKETSKHLLRGQTTSGTGTNKRIRSKSDDTDERPKTAI